MKEKLKSRKLWFGVLSCILGAFYPPALPILKIVAPAYLIGQGAADAMASFNGVKSQS